MAADETLSGFVRDALARGEPRERIRAVLAQAGWDEAQVRRALEGWAEVEFPVPVPRPRPYVSAAEAFQYLVLFSALYALAFNIGAIAFAAIDLAFPDPAAAAGVAERVRDGVRFPIASLLVAAPLFWLMARRLSSALEADPTRRQSRIRKWLTYLTLYFTGSCVAGDVIALVYSFLGGDLTAPSLLKGLVIALIAGSAFGWYLADVRRDEAAPVGPQARRMAGLVVAAAVVAALAGGLLLIGSPARARTTRLDARRVADLQAIAGGVDLWWTRRGALPPSLDSLARSQPSVNRRDPATGARYEYRALTDATYELCATFEAPPDRPDAADGFWTHGAGRQCFALSAKRVAP